jgi:hypothetical protein
LLKSDFTSAVHALRSASALTESTFLQVGELLEASVEVLAKLTTGFETMRVELDGENLGQAFNTLSRVAARVNELSRDQSRESAIFDHLRRLTQSIEERISQMKTSLKGVDALAINSKIAAANIHASGMDFTTFADEIGRTLNVTRANLDNFASELRTVRQCVAQAYTRQLLFENCRDEAARSITERLTATMASLAQQHQRARRASLAVNMGSVRVQQRIAKAIMALQIGDVTRQRLEHADNAVGLLRSVRIRSDAPGALNEDEQHALSVLVQIVQAAQLLDAAKHFDREVTRITESLESLAVEARALCTIGNSTFASPLTRGGTFTSDLEGQVAETLLLFEGFETAQTEVASVVRTVSEATATLGAHLLKVRSLEADIRIMGLNTTFKCARVGREGLALSIIAQELRTYANGFAKEADALMGEVEIIAKSTLALTTGRAREDAGPGVDGTQAIKDSLFTLRQVGQILNSALQDLERDSERVVTMLTETVENLGSHNEIGPMLRQSAESFFTRTPSWLLRGDKLAPAVQQFLDLMANGYTMAQERAVQDKMLRRPASEAAEPRHEAETELEDFLF